MLIDDNLKQFVRTLIQDDLAENDRYAQALHESGWHGWPQLLASLFSVAVRRRFGAGYTEREIIQFVADLRIEALDGEFNINALHTEALIKAILHPPVALDVPIDELADAQALVTYTLLRQENLSDAALDEVLAEAVAIAERLPDPDDGLST
jgi:hypothetical protein